MVRNQKRPKDWSKVTTTIEGYELEMMKEKRQEMWNKRHEEITTEVKKKTKVAKSIIQEEGEISDTEIEKSQLSRRERQELGKQKSQALYEKLLADTELQPSELARLDILKHKRDEAQKKRELNKQKREEAAARKAARK